MATTRLISMHLNKGKSIADCIADRTDYAINPDKTNDGVHISSYECDPKTVQGEFLLSKRIYSDITGREQANDVIAYQIRQSFKPGEVTPELANKIGYELGMKFTKGNHAFIVATHIDKAHIHNHIIYNFTSDNFNQLSAEIKTAEKRMTEIANFKTHIINYSKTRDIYIAYRKAGYSKKFYEEHTADLLLHKAAKDAFDELDDKKLPTVKVLQREYSELIFEKKNAYAKYHSTKKEMKNILTAKANIDRLLGENISEKEKEKSQEQR